MSFLTELIHTCIKNDLLNVYTSIPGKVVKYDKDKQLAQVKPLPMLQTKSYDTKEAFIDPENAEYKEIDVIFNVMVKHTSSNSGKTFIHTPIKKGDLGMIMFSNRSLESYTLNKGEKYKVEDKRTHDLSDAFFIPGVVPAGKALNIPDNNNVVVKHSDDTNSMELILYPDGKIKIKGNDKEMVNILVGALDSIYNYAGSVNQMIMGISSVTIPTALGGAVLAALYGNFVPNYTDLETHSNDINIKNNDLKLLRKT